VSGSRASARLVNPADRRGDRTGPDGHCSLRENRDSDEDEVIGLGSGATVGLALVAALLRVALARAAR